MLGTACMYKKKTSEHSSGLDPVPTGKGVARGASRYMQAMDQGSGKTHNIGPGRLYDAN